MPDNMTRKFPITANKKNTKCRAMYFSFTKRCSASLRALLISTKPTKSAIMLKASQTNSTHAKYLIIYNIACVSF